MLKILVADDHEVVRRGLRDILTDAFEEVRVGEAADSDEALAKVSAEEWDLVLLDILMPGAGIVESIETIKANYPDLPILILTAVSELEYAVRTLKAGANGYITKQYASDELLLAIQRVLDGETYVSGDTASALAASLREDKEPLPHEKLSPRELEIFCLIARGRTVKEIAGDLGCSDKTVATHISRIKEKTDLVSYVDIARYALLNKLVD